MVKKDRHDKITRTAYSYDMFFRLKSGLTARGSVILMRQDPERAISEAFKKMPDAEHIEIRACYKELYALEPSRYFAEADMITRESVIIDGAYKTGAPTGKGRKEQNE